MAVIGMTDSGWAFGGIKMDLFENNFGEPEYHILLKFYRPSFQMHFKPKIIK